MNSKEEMIVFLGGIFTPNQIKYINKHSLGPMQNAADSLQKNLISGMDSLEVHGLSIVNLPFVGSYPLRFKSIYFPATREYLGSSSRILGIGFINMTCVKLISRLISALNGLLSLPKSNKKIIIIYSAHAPFFLAAMLYKTLNRGVVLCQIVPDLPEFMGGSGFFYNIFKRIDQSLFYYFVRKMDYVVVLTRFMIEKLNVDLNKCLVMEGVASDGDCVFSDGVELLNSKVFLYTGTLSIRYGISDLLEAFCLVDDPDAELWICGDGDGRQIVKNYVLNDSRIKYFGQVERGEAVRLQQMATFLVNPRKSEDEYTKYSFPSKILEYMASGRPVIMHHLEGIPDEYLPYFIRPESLELESLAKCMRHAIQMSEIEIKDLGFRAKEFVLSNKNSKIQAQKIINFLRGGEK